MSFWGIQAVKIKEEKQRHVMPYGKHRGKELDAIPSDYLCWFLSKCKVSPGLLRAIQAELQSRGQVVELPPEDTMPPVCSACGSDDLLIRWQTLSDGRKFIKAVCKKCCAGKWLPQTKTNIGLADHADCRTWRFHKCKGKGIQK